MTGSTISIKPSVVLVTRPAKQVGEFIDLIRDNGFDPLAFPCIEIQPVELTEPLKSVLKSLETNDIIIFISANAVEYAATELLKLGIAPDSITVKMATIGKATLAAAKDHGFNIELSPVSGFNSESLLALNALQAKNINGLRCLIFRGVGGLEYLADELRQRGAKVKYAQVYQRNKPLIDSNISRVKLSENWGELGIHAITVTSNESLQNLYDMLELPGKAVMLETPLIVASQRGFELAQQLGFKSITRAASAINQHMLDALKKNLNERMI